MLYQHLVTTARRRAEHTAVVAGEHQLTYAELFSAVDELANVLAQARVGPGHVVLALFDNVPAFLVTLIAATKLGATFAPLEVSATDAEAEDVLALTGTDLIVCGPSDRERCSRLSQRWILLDESGALLASHMAQPSAPSVEPGIGCMQLSSGTTGASKGILLSDEAFLFRSLYLTRALQLGDDDRTLCTLPLSHTHGSECLALPTLMAGGTLHLIPPRFAFPLYVLEELSSRQITFFSSIPQFYDTAVKLSPKEPPDLSALRHPFCGSAALSRTTAERFFERYGVHIRQGYGLAELSVICVNFLAGEGIAYDSVGTPIDGIEWKLTGDGDEGELLVRSKAMFSGYIHAPELTREKLDGGWLHTGDIVHVDDHGLFRIVGRKDDFIKVRGFKVYCSEVEQALIASQHVHECAVVAHRDELGSESVIALIVPTHRGETRVAAQLETELKRELGNRLSDYKIPRRILVREALPKNALGKILKSKVSASLSERQLNP